MQEMSTSVFGFILCFIGVVLVIYLSLRAQSKGKFGNRSAIKKILVSQFFHVSMSVCSTYLYYTYVFIVPGTHMIIIIVLFVLILAA